MVISRKTHKQIVQAKDGLIEELRAELERAARRHDQTLDTLLSMRRVGYEPQEKLGANDWETYNTADGKPNPKDVEVERMLAETRPR